MAPYLMILSAFVILSILDYYVNMRSMFLQLPQTYSLAQNPLQLLQHRSIMQVLQE